MSGVMSAIIKSAPGPENVVLSDVPEPVAAAGQARIRVLATGICGTDIHVAHDEYPCEPPVVMGHELSLIHI